MSSAEVRWLIPTAGQPWHAGACRGDGARPHSGSLEGITAAPSKRWPSAGMLQGDLPSTATCGSLQPTAQPVLLWFQALPVFMLPGPVRKRLHEDGLCPIGARLCCNACLQLSLQRLCIQPMGQLHLRWLRFRWGRRYRSGCGLTWSVFNQACYKPLHNGKVAKRGPPVLDIVEAQVEADGLGQQG